MNRYKVVENKILLASGVLQLDQSQADSRQYALKSLGDGLYLIEKPVEFKRGEEFGYDGEVTKRMLVDMDLLVNPAGKASAAEKGKGKK